jgi:hypothetical protein
MRLLQGPRQRLVLLAAARNAGVSIEVMEARLQVLTLAWLDKCDHCYYYGIIARFA